MRSKKETKKIEKITKKPGRKSAAKKVQIVEEVQDDDNPTASIEDFNSTVDTSFFYTNDKHLNAIDDVEVINRIMSRYPDFN